MHRLLATPLIDERLYAAVLGGGKSDLAALARYAGLPPDRRPSLSPYFLPAWYRETTPGVPADVDPLLHFLEVGLAQWRSPHPLIDLHYMAGQDSRLFSPLPTAAGLVMVLEEDLVSPSPYLDADHYRIRMGEQKRAVLRHYLEIGMQAGHRLNAWLDLAWYEAKYDDVVGGPLVALCDFVVRGDPSARAAGPAFDGARYQRRYPDVIQAATPPLWHFLVHGRREGRFPG